MRPTSHAAGVRPLAVGPPRPVVEEACQASPGECAGPGRQDADRPPAGLDGRLLTVEQAGKRLNLSSRPVYKKCLTGELRPIKIDRTIYVPLTEVEPYEARRCVTGRVDSGR